jgi:predicted unusual protein kinase regulating ubiquinone biosynthesis (AarF/ABC1/UbiB family)
MIKQQSINSADFVTSHHRTTKKLLPLQRQIKIFHALGDVLLVISADLLLNKNRPQRQHRPAQKLVNTLIRLGPTFIKIGQTLSTRVDLLPPAYVEALAQLQDRVPAFSTTTAIKIIERELGQPLSQLYQEFELQPIAAASLGQVHRARLPSGELVVVKVQRPGLEELFRLDFQILQQLLQFCENKFPWTRTYGLTAIYQDFFTLLFQEIDYVNEGQNADRFRHNFRSQKMVIAPTIYWRLTTSKVLTMSYLPGIKIDRKEELIAAGFQPAKINQIGICCYLQQLMIDGFFQGDPHPGNMAITTEGKLAVYDFGMMTQLQPNAKEQMIDTFLSIIRKDATAVVQNLTAMGLLVEVENMRPIKKVISFLLDRFTERPVNMQEFEEIRLEVANMYAQQPFRLPSEMVAILKALSTLDGIARTLDPEYNLVAAAQPFIRRIALSERKTIGRRISQQAGKFITQRLRGKTDATALIQQLEEQLAATEAELIARSISQAKSLKRLQLAGRSLVYLLVSALSLVAGILLLPISQIIWVWCCFGLAGLSGLVGLRYLLQFIWQEQLDKFIG